MNEFDKVTDLYVHELAEQEKERAVVTIASAAGTVQDLRFLTKMLGLEDVLMTMVSGDQNDDQSEYDDGHGPTPSTPF